MLSVRARACPHRHSCSHPPPSTPQHVMGHHIYTNVFSVDPDLPAARTGDLRRIVPSQMWAGVYKYQHLYLPLAYGLLAIKFRLQDISSLWASGSNGAVRVNYYSSPLLRVGLTKLVWASWRFGVPAVYGSGWGWSALALNLLAELVAGWWLAWNFQVSHITTQMEWPGGVAPGESVPAPSAPASPPTPILVNKASNGQETLSDSWAVTQVRTSLDYGHGDAVATFLCGALNYQIEHHLFPGVSQYHYPALAPIVMATCKEFGVPYRYERTFWDAWGAHVAHLKAMGARGEAAHID